MATLSGPELFIAWAIGTYEDPRLFWMVGAAFWSGVSFLLLATPYVLIDWINPTWAQAARMGSRPVFDPNVLRRTLGLFCVNVTLLVVLSYCLWPILSLSSVHLGPLPGAPIIAAQLLGCWWIDEVGTFVQHRLLHHPMLYRSVHRVHHEVRVSTALAGAHFHPIEYLMLAISFMLGPLLLGLHIYVLLAWVFVRQWIGVEGHCGYRKSWSPLRWVPGYDGPGFHHAHHLRGQVNFGTFFRYFDAWAGTLQRSPTERRPRRID